MKVPEGATIEFKGGNKSMRREGEPTVAGRPSVGTGENSITWTPVSPSANILKFNGTDYHATREALGEAFGPFPMRLSKDKHLSILWGMQVGAGEGRAPFAELHAALDQYGELELQCL